MAKKFLIVGFLLVLSLLLFSEVRAQIIQINPWKGVGTSTTKILTPISSGTYVGVNISAPTGCSGSNALGTSATGTIICDTDDNTGGSGGGVATSSGAAATRIAFFTDASTINGSGSLIYDLQTGLWQNFKVTSSTEMRSPSSTLTALTGTTIQGFNLSNCTGSSNKLTWRSASNDFACETDQTGVGGTESGWRTSVPFVYLATSTDSVGIGATSSVAKLFVQSTNVASTTVSIQGLANQTANLLSVASSGGRIHFEISNLGVASSTELRSPSATIGVAGETGQNLSLPADSSNILMTGSGSGASLGSDGLAFYDDDVFTVGVAPWAYLYSLGTSTLNIQGAANSAVLSMLSLTTDRTFTFPDLAGTFALTGASQNVSFGNVSSTNLTASGFLQGATLNISGQSTLASVSSTNITVTGYGTFPTLNFTNASGSRATLSTSVDSPKGILTDVSSTRVTATTLIDTPRILATNASTTGSLTLGFLQGGSDKCLTADSGGNVTSTGSACGAGGSATTTRSLSLLVGFGTNPTSSGEVYWDNSVNVMTNDLVRGGIWVFGTSTAAAPTEKQELAFRATIPANATSGAYSVDLFWASADTNGSSTAGIQYRCAGSGETVDYTTFQETVTSTDDGLGTAFFLNLHTFDITDTNCVADDQMDGHIFFDFANADDTLDQRYVLDAVLKYPSL